MKTGRRNFLKGVLGAAVVPLLVTSAKELSKEEVIEKTTPTVADGNFNCVICQYRGDDWKQKHFAYKAVRNVGKQLQHGDMVMWADEEKREVTLWEPVMQNPMQNQKEPIYAGTVSTIEDDYCGTTG
jgi:hypothetical protein